MEKGEKRRPGVLFFFPLLTSFYKGNEEKSKAPLFAREKENRGECALKLALFALSLLLDFEKPCIMRDRWRKRQSRTLLLRGEATE